MSTASRDIWNQLIRQLEMEPRPRRHIKRKVPLNRSMLGWLLSFTSYHATSMPLHPHLYPHPPSLCWDCTLPLRPLPPPLEVDELIHQQKGAGQVGDAGLWTATVAARVTTWNVPEREREKERQRWTWKSRRRSKRISNINKDCMEKMKSEELMKVKWWQSREMHEWGQKEKDKQAVWAGIIFIQLHHYRGRVWGMPF